MRNPALLLAIVQAQDADAATQALTQAGLRATRISTIGGFLRESNVTLLIGLEHGDIARAAQLLSQHCRKRITYVNAARAMTAYDAALAMPIEVEVGGATIFALAVTRYVRFGAEPFQSSAPREGGSSMKLVMAIADEKQATQIMNALVAAKYQATMVSTTGGFLRRGNATLLIGVESEKVQDVLNRIEGATRGAPQEPGRAGATVFVLEVEDYLRV